MKILQIPDFDRAPWTKDAACRGCSQVSFYPQRGEPAEPARAICASCPVREECLDFALRNRILGGIWGGLSDKERRKIPTYKAKRTPRESCEQNA